ncbi:hypothetical protein BP6252_10583 [Coleophoma cylindrospora]|uniref:Endothelin-converting enzyme 1 n=1 Tax=Coleophoma cylindrospora TaxID=1849047 RepID=A0A3D8QT30_9HELO|nr:hypothetical protein BP6252_10583 [Coleophoma cylindrospora]
MAAPPRQSTQGDETTPLLSSAEGDGHARRPVSAWKRAGKWIAEHATTVFMSLLIAAVIVLLVVFIISLSPKKVKTKAGVCSTPACVHAASEILYNLSPEYKTIDPCTDFEELVCGGWGDRHDLRPDQGDAFTGTIMSENSQTLLRHILEAPYPEDSKHSQFSPAMLTKPISSVDQQNFEKLKSAYDACMDEETIKKAGVKPLMDIIEQVIQKFPSKKSKDGDALASTILYLEELGVSSVVSLGAGADDKDPDVVVVQAMAPWTVGLPAKDYYEDGRILGKYQAVLSEVLGALFPDSKDTNSTASNVVKFEKFLAAASPDPEDAYDVTKSYNPMSLKDADKLTPEIRLGMVINSLAPEDYKTNRIIVGSPKYMAKLSEALSDTPTAVLQNFFVWKVIQAFSSVIEADELKPYSRFRNELSGKDPDSTPERWRTCVGHVDNGLGWILSRFFVEKAFSAKAKDFGDQIVSDIKEMFIEKLKASSWMDKSVIELAIEKVHKIVQKIGYPTKSPDIMDPPSLKKYYNSVDISGSKFFENAIAMNKFAVGEQWSSLSKPVDREEWGMTVPTVNAYYNPPGNEIVFPAGIMQFPVFDVNVPQYLSYGAFGAVSGHELSHAFDSTGRHYDQNGNYTDWWTNSTVQAFEKKADCFVEQYHNYTIEGSDGKVIHVNGRLTLGENIADAGGITASFSAWKKRQAETPNKDLPGLEHFTQEQLFFVSYANWWCGKSRKETAINRIYTDPHAPKWARILGTMANSRDFAESFSCPRKEPVCELW